MSDDATDTRRALQRAVAGARRLAAGAETRLDRVRWGAKRRFGWIDPVQIQAYRGFGTAARVTLQGRIIEQKLREPAAEHHGRWTNFVRMVRTLDSNEVPDVRVALHFAGTRAEASTDAEGYFAFEVAPTAPLAATTWHEATLELPEQVAPGQGAVSTRAEILIPGPSAEVGIISDIDDTVLQTHVTSRFKMLSVTLLHSVFTRLSFEGTTELYRALVAGRSGRADNPVFYVSKSPWSLHPLLTEFMDRQSLPRGPLLLRGLGLHSEATLDFKASRIARLLAAYPALRFVLLGDSGERDPEIYLEALAAHPGRIAAIYIRDVSKLPGRRTQLERHAARARALGADLVLMNDPAVALAHARSVGIIA